MTIPRLSWSCPWTVPRTCLSLRISSQVEIVRHYVIQDQRCHGLYPEHMGSRITSRVTSRTTSRVWRGMIWSPSSESWLSGLALSHIQRLNLVRRAKSTFVRYLSRRLTSLSPTNEESSWLNEENNLIGKKIVSRMSAVTWHVWLVWFTNNLSVRVYKSGD